MKNYEKYALEDFVQDFYFRQWALGMLDPKDNFWQTWSESNPEKKLLMEEAASMVVGLAFKPEEVDASEVSQAIASISQRLHKPPFFRRKWFSCAAAVLLPAFIFMTLWVYLKDHSQEKGYGHARLAESGATWHTNESNDVITIPLSEGSTVKLSPDSRLRVDGQFGKANRTVWLEGEASFDVIRKTDRPFIVKSHNVVTKVLGTVFRVKAYDYDENVSVSVSSGKVTVQKTAEDQQEDETVAEMVLTPNQLAVISRKNDKIIKTLIDAPAILRLPDQHQRFTFNDTPIPEVFAALEQAYGIPIAYDKENLAKCNLTARMTKEDLFNKLDLICETIQVSYRITDGQILIDGPGCD